ncbi:MAG: hypothetical protein ABFS86_01870 [Planctomycetota bacterium]
MVESQKILVVEHEPGERDPLLSVLSREFDVTGAGGGVEAAERLRSDRYDLVLLGGLREGADTQALQNGICSSVPRPKVILLAAAFTDEILTRATLLQADGVLKSFDAEEVAASVAAHLGS